MSNLDLFSGKDKAEIAIERLQTFCPPEGYYVAFSGGKDSVVILDLVKRSGCKYDAHYNLTTVDPPELVRFIRDEHPEVEIHKPKESMFQLIARKGIVPTRRIRFCCSELKEKGGEGRFVVVGIRWAESYGRSKRKMVEACFRDSRKFYIRPIIDWTDEDVWSYIKSRGIQYCSLYDEGFKRIGCIMCPMAGANQMLRDAERWPKYAKAYRIACIKAVKTRIEKGLECKTDFSTGDRLYNWFIHQSTKPIDEEQAILFE